MGPRVLATQQTEVGGCVRPRVEDQSGLYNQVLPKTENNRQNIERKDCGQNLNFKQLKKISYFCDYLTSWLKIGQP